MYLGSVSVSDILTATQSRRNLIFNVSARLMSSLDTCVLANVSLGKMS